MKLSLFNHPWIKKVTANKQTLKQQEALQAMQRFIAQYESRFHLIPAPLVFDKTDFDELSAATKTLMAVQKKILDVLIHRFSKEEMLDYFDLPQEILPLIDWHELSSGENMIARFDVLPNEGGYQFCEINAESCIGGLKLRDCYKKNMLALGIDYDLDESPRQAVADYLQQKVGEKNLEHVVIFSMKQYLEEGTGTVRALYDTVCQTIKDKKVILAHEGDFPEALLTPEKGAKTLVYRLAMYEDVNCQALFRNIFASGATMVNSFASEIRSNKKWFAIFHNPQFHELLTEKELKTITKFVPYTGYLTYENIEQVLKEKDNLVFKKNRAYGGHGVLMGREHELSTLQEKIADLTHWTFQKLVQCNTIDLPLDDSFNLTACKVVLGLFLINNQNSGMLIRASNKSSIVSVATGGAHIGWMIPMTSSQRDNLIQQVDSSIDENEEIEKSRKYTVF
ncbi:Glutathionylspermidine synthase [Legionella beliardensis]|uniref:Glutathionylspermidine synthase n=1 Tax=Legionella beliardensis TaxID=91822 RepID=A0A378I4H3_9GAMM|nr:glutathionylspermidine synthase family protein [Legionella beliardensis]STX29732.1 Glutathionylspermidine synthase [Legionella beliardensis]